MGDFLLSHVYRLASMLLLLALSGFFSGSETALFNLSRERLRRFRQGARLERLAAGLVDRPRPLLVSILLGNMVVNVTFFALASGVAWDLGLAFGRVWGGAAGVSALVLVVVFGEVVPKTIAAASPAGLAKFSGLPLYLLCRALAPIVYLLDRGLIEPFSRLVTGRKEARGELLLTTDELQAIVELAADEGVVGRDESEMLADVIELHQTRVREVMIPRVEVTACEVGTPTAGVLDIFRRTRRKRFLVYRGSADNVVGLVSARAAFLHPERPLAELLEPVHFVPEQQTVEKLLKVFREKKIQLAVVVDEYGGMAGLATLEDCVEEIVGDILDEDDQPLAAVERLSDREFILPGNLSMRAWDDYIRAELDAEVSAATLGGFVTDLLGRIPQAGDACRYGNLRFTVLEVVCRIAGGHCRPARIRVEILEAPPELDEGRGGGPGRPGAPGPGRARLPARRGSSRWPRGRRAGGGGRHG